MKTPIQLLIEDFKKMRENILKQEQDIKSSKALTTLNMCITKAEENNNQNSNV